MAEIAFTDDDEGKRVVDSEGSEVGKVTEVQGSTAYVDPDPSLMESLKSRLGWADADEDTYPLDADDVTDITDDEVRIRRF